MTLQNEKNNFRDVVRFELSDTNRWSRETVTVAVGQKLAMGAVLGKILLSIPTVGTPDSNNTGSATVTDVAGGAKTKKGVYKIECISSDPASIMITDPDGIFMLPTDSFGKYENEQISFTLTNGSPGIDAGDKWTITVAEGSGKVKEVDLSAIDGSQNAYGILCSEVDTTLAETDAVAVVRDARFVAANLVYPSAITDEQKALILASLARNNIIPVDEA
jgi:hypothetical protein